MKKSVSIIGLGKLGLNMAACLAYKGHQTIGVDINSSLLKNLKKGISPIYEPGLQEKLEAGFSNLEFTDQVDFAVRNSEIIFIFVGSPSEKDGSFSSKYAEIVAKQIGESLKNINDYRLIVNRTTVMPGVTQGDLNDIIQEASGKKVGTDYGLCFNPEFMALGSAIHNFFNPDVIAIGEYDEKSGAMLESLYKDVCDNDPAVVRTSITNAEWSKLSLNVFLIMKLSYANAIAEVCEIIDGGDSDKISDILGHDPRIGRKFLSGAIGYGGPCFPRDTIAFNAFTKKLGVPSEFSEAAERVNDRQAERVIKNVGKILGGFDEKTICVLGVTYKPNTELVNPSDQLKIVQLLLDAGLKVRLTDPQGIRNAKIILGNENIEYFETAEESISNSDLCIVTTPWKEYIDLEPETFVKNMRNPMVYDCWRAMEKVKIDSRIKYFGLGTSSINFPKNHQ